MGLGVQIGITLLLTPIVLSHLGLEAYGLWLLLQGFVGYYGLVDMGLRAGITQSITHRIAAEDYEAVRFHVAVSRPILLKISGAVVLGSLLASWLLPIFVQTASELRTAFTAVVIIQGIGVATRLPLMPYSAILVGLQRYDYANAIAVLTRVTYAIAAYTVLQFGGGIVALSITLATTNLIDSLLRMLLAYRLVPDLRGTVEGDRKSDVQELVQFGVWNFMIQIGRRIIYYSDVLVVGILFSAAAIAPYALAGSLVEYCNKLVRISTRVLYPTMANLHVKGKKEQQLVLYTFTTRVCLMVSIGYLIIGYVHTKAFLTLWLSGSADSVTIIEQAPTLFILIGLGATFISMQRSGLQLLLAAKKLKFLAIVLFSEAAANLLLSVTLGFWIGVKGVAIGTLIPAVVIGLACHLGAHAKVLETDRRTILRSTIPGPAGFAIALAGFAWAGHFFMFPILTWTDLVLSTAIYVAVAMVLVPIGFRSSERKAAWRAISNRLGRSKHALSRGDV